MVIVGNWRTAIIGSIVSLIIFGVVYFTVIKPNSDTANQAIRTGLQQSQQALNQAKSSLSQSGVPSSVSKQAQTALSNASKLASCVQAAGTDVSALSACQAKYHG
jgi:type II secretory pathway component PulM